MAGAFHEHAAVKSWNRCSTFGQPQPDRDGPVQRFQPIQHLLAEVLDREATHLPGQALQGLNGHAVVQAPAQVVGHGSSFQIELNAEIKAEPLAIPTFVFQYPDVGPQPQVCLLYTSPSPRD